MLSDDGSLPEDCALAQWGKYFFEGSKWQLNHPGVSMSHSAVFAGHIFGTAADAPKYIKPLMQDAGFVDIEEHILKLPIGPWARDPRLKRVGYLEMLNMTDGIQGLTMMLFTRALGWRPEEVEVFLANVRKDVENRHIHAYYHL